PNWITYERIGTNGNSPICQMSIAEMQDYLDQSPSTASPPQPSASWGALRHHMYHGAVYHAHLMRGAARYPNYQPHRGVSVTSEAKAAAQSLLARPLAMLERAWKMHRLRRQPYRNHVVLCQLAHDSSLRAHGPFHTDGEFFETVIMAFAEGSTAKDRLIFKAHPLEDNFGEMRQSVASLARDYDLPPERVICLPGGRLAPLLDIATTAITVTSTAAMQALWRGLPLYCFGHTIYDKPGLTFEGNLQDFFTKAAPPDAQAFDILRRFLLAGCQLPGGFYTPKGRKQTIARLVPLMLRKRPIYDLDVAVTDLHFGPRLIASQNSPHVPR
ncbi:MAG: capsule biosynthesis protein CapA, partial [Mangrovicoccus sp.]